MMGRSIVSTIILLYAFSAFAEGGYTNHAGNVVAGWPVKLTQKEVTLVEGVATNGCQLTTNGSSLSTTNAYPLSIFPESEQRRIAADFLLRQGSGGQVGLLRVPVAVKRYHGGGEGDGAIAQARGEGPLHEGGERRLLREVRSCAQELSRQAGKGRRNHPRRAKGARTVNGGR